VVLACAEIKPGQQLFGRNFGMLRPVLDVVDNRVASVVGNPTSLQSSPLAFFALTFSSINSEMTSFLF
jgi:hypothetical protein